MLTKKSDRPSFELFRSSTCHKLKDLGDLPFITQLLETNQIRAYYNRKWYPEALYLLAMLDYLTKCLLIEPLLDGFVFLQDGAPNLFAQSDHAANPQAPTTVIPFVAEKSPVTTPGASQEAEIPRTMT